MNYKILFLSIISAITGGSATSFAQTAADTIVDNDIVYPSSFDTDVRNLQNHWYMRRYAVLDSVARHRTGKPASDEVYIQRLQALPTVIPMVYNSVVKNYIEMYANKKPELVEKMLGLSLYYMPYFEDALERLQMPVELKYLPIIESALDPNAISRAGAVGLWQFMSATAQGEGLEINSLVDQRRDPIAASHAACGYLKKLYNMFGDWTLALAAYNCGPGNVTKAMKRAGDSTNYWEIYPYLPKETRGYVPAFIAANYIMNYYAEHGISHALAKRPVVTDTVHVNHRVHFEQISEVLDIPMGDIRTLNPQYREDIVPGHIRPYAIILPSEMAYCFVANEDTILNHNASKYFGLAVVEPSDGTTKADGKGQYVEELQIVTHKVAKGETLKSIASHYGVTVESIRKASKITSSKIKTGAVLKIPTYAKRYIADNGESADSDMEVQNTTVDTPTTVKAASTTPAPKPKETTKATTPSAPAQAKPVSYKVKKGDTLDKIARQHGVTVKAIQNANGLKNTVIQIGQRLTIPAKTATKSTTSSSKKKSTKKK